MDETQMIKTFTYDCDFDGSLDYVTTIDVDKDNNVLLTDKSNLKMYSHEGKYIKQCELDGPSWGLSCHKKSSTIVVSLKGKGIQIINDFKPESNMPVPSMTSCYGITFINDNIAVGGDGKISILDFNGKHIRTITTETLSIVFYLHNYQGKLYFTDLTNKVCCVKEDGTQILTITKLKIRAIGTINTDDSGNLYMASCDTSNIVRVSQNDRNSQKIFKTDNDITEPFAFCFSRDYKSLFVSFMNGKVVKKFKCEY